MHFTFLIRWGPAARVSRLSRPAASFRSVANQVDDDASVRRGLLFRSFRPGVRPLDSPIDPTSYEGPSTNLQVGRRAQHPNFSIRNREQAWKLPSTRQIPGRICLGWLHWAWRIRMVRSATSHHMRPSSNEALLVLPLNGLCNERFRSIHLACKAHILSGPSLCPRPHLPRCRPRGIVSHPRSAFR